MSAFGGKADIGPYLIMTAVVCHFATRMRKSQSARFVGQGAFSRTTCSGANSLRFSAVRRHGRLSPVRKEKSHASVSVGNSTAALEANLVASFREGLRELGYEEGRNIAIDYRWADGQYERFAALVAELIAAKVDVIVTAGTPAALAVKKATNTMPLVMVAVGDPVGTGIVPNLARPGGNITGLSSIAPDLEGKRLGLLRGCRSQCLARRLFPQSGKCISFGLYTAGARRGPVMRNKAAAFGGGEVGAARRRIRLHRQGKAGCAPPAGGPHISFTIADA